jgi:hypothetical protein
VILVHRLLQITIDLLVIFLIGVQIADVHSTILALRLPWVQEVGDESIGLGNISGWAQRHLGPVWWVIKAPFLTFLPMLWTPIEPEVQVPVIMLLILANGYFFQITKQNYANARSTPPIGYAPNHHPKAGECP